ncbi:hypothetical protein [Nostoc sp.]|uniref:hypothetical protein n=1 Tax=Nostoc sp. TaxID=1180 RepID=UPI002FF949B5
MVLLSCVTEGGLRRAIAPDETVSAPCSHHLVTRYQSPVVASIADVQQPPRSD